MTRDEDIQPQLAFGSEDAVPDITTDEAKALIAAAPFQVAKSMPKIPHAYTLTRKWASREDFEKLVMHIRRNGVQEKFFSKTYTYLYLDGYKYWTMGAPLAITILINRAKA